MLTGNDITKKREVYKLPFLECLDELNRIIWKAEIENKILKDK